MDLAHTRSTDEVLDHFQVSASEGLSNDQVEKSREKYGLNGMTYLSLHYMISIICLHLSSALDCQPKLKSQLFVIGQFEHFLLFL